MIEINKEILQDIINISTGLFAPLKGFMNYGDFKNVVENMRLDNGEIWTIPITLDTHETIKKDKLTLYYKKNKIAEIEVEDVYKITENDIKQIYGTTDLNHPGVKKEFERGKYRIGGNVKLIDEDILRNQLNPSKTKALFKKKGWKTVVGFQTRNVPHRAHEYLQRLALEFCEALFINPLVGWKKKGDFSELAVDRGYRALIENYFTNLNVYYETLKTPMRYAGPREAIFHAIIRKNLGCSHFIIGRDHAGVGNYYHKYEAHELALKLQKYMDIQLLLFKGPFFCPKCDQILTENCCGHKNIVEISGTIIRDMLSNGKTPPNELMREEVAMEIIKLKERMFIQ